MPAPEAHVAQLIANSAAAVVEALGLMSDNLERLSGGNAPAYTSEAFLAILDERGLDHNSITSIIREL